LLGISVVIPVLNDVEAARCILGQIAPDPRVEVILVDGGADHRLDAVAGGRAGTRLLRTQPGRARQMNAGAREASESGSSFSTPDSQLPDGWREAVTALPQPIVGGWFRFALDDDAWQARVIERLVAWRVRALKLPYGDQGLLVRRAVFSTLVAFASCRCSKMSSSCDASPVPARSPNCRCRCARPRDAGGTTDGSGAARAIR
jgi:glycosyltransferase involved in cell wall biosynthesis